MFSFDNQPDQDLTPADVLCIAEGLDGSLRNEDRDSQPFIVKAVQEFLDKKDVEGAREYLRKTLDLMESANTDAGRKARGAQNITLAQWIQNGGAVVHTAKALTERALSARFSAQRLTPLQISNGARTGPLPTRLKLLEWGANSTTSKGLVRVGERTKTELPRLQIANGFDKIALDFNHNSLPKHENFQPEPRHVAGYGVPLVIPGDGLYLDRIEYTPSGEKYARDYADLSPTPLLDEGEVIFLHSVALCPQGEVNGLSFLGADFCRLSDLVALSIGSQGAASNAVERAVMTALAAASPGLGHRNRRRGLTPAERAEVDQCAANERVRVSMRLSPERFYGR